MKTYPIALWNSLLLVLLLSGSSAAKAGRSCSYDPSLGKPNPLGMRTYITATEEQGKRILISIDKQVWNYSQHPVSRQ